LTVCVNCRSKSGSAARAAGPETKEKITKEVTLKPSTRHLMSAVGRISQTGGDSGGRRTAFRAFAHPSMGLPGVTVLGPKGSPVVRVFVPPPAVRSCRPIPAEYFRLFQHGPRRLLLLVGRVAAFFRMRLTITRIWARTDSLIVQSMRTLRRTARCVQWLVALAATLLCGTAQAVPAVPMAGETACPTKLPRPPEQM
jgi:hypothetical protein